MEQQQIEKLKQMYLDGIPIDEIAKEFNCTISAIRNRVRRLGLKRKRVWTKEGLERRRRRTSEQFRGKKKIWHISREELSTIYSRAKKNWWKNLDEEKKQKIIQHLREISPKGNEVIKKKRTGNSNWNCWNKGMHPWEWMRISKDDFFKMLGNCQKRRPTNIEKVIIELIDKHNLPWRYVGDGQLWIDGKNPDFVHKDKKIIIEALGRYWHSKIEIKDRKQHFEKYNWKVIFLWEEDLANEQLILDVLNHPEKFINQNFETSEKGNSEKKCPICGKELSSGKKFNNCVMVCRQCHKDLEWLTKAAMEHKPDFNIWNLLEALIDSETLNRIKNS